MGVQLPQKNLSNDEIKRRQFVDNSQAMISVRGNNPYAKAIDQLAPIIANALIQRQQMKEQARQAALVRESLAKGAVSEGIENPSTILDTYKAISNRSKQDGVGKRSYTVLETEFRKDPEKYRLLESSGVDLKIIKDDSPEESARIFGNLEVRKQQRLDKNTQALSKRLEDIGTPEAITQFDTLSKLIPKEGDVPGIGVVEGSLPSYMLSPEGRAVRQAIATLQNVKIKDRSGAAVTVPEFERLREEFGTGKFKTVAQLRQGLDQALKAYTERTRNTLSGFDKETKDAYFERENTINPLSVLSSYSFGSALSNKRNVADDLLREFDQRGR